MGIFGLGACATPRNHPALCHRIIVKSCNARSDCCACRVSNGIKILRQEEANIMRKLLLFSLLLTISAGAVAQTAASPSAATSAISISSNGPVVADYGKQPQSSDPVENNIAKEVRHELLMVPYYSLFDDLGYTVQGRTESSRAPSATHDELPWRCCFPPGRSTVVVSRNRPPPARCSRSKWPKSQL